MNKHIKEAVLPVSQRQLAQYLGISSSMMHMAESSRHPSHQLSAASSGKLSALVAMHLQGQRTKGNGDTWKKLQHSIRQRAAKELKMLELTVDHANAKITVLENKLKAMQQQETADRQWLNTTDKLLHALTPGKEKQADAKWLAWQQSLAEKRLLKNSWLQQAKLQMLIEQEKAKITYSQNLLKKLKTKKAV